MRNTARAAQSDRPEQRLYYRAREVAALTGLGLRTIYECVYAGWIPSRKIGNSRLIPARWLSAGTDLEADAIAESERANILNNRYSLGALRPRASGAAHALRQLAVAFRAISFNTKKAAMLAL